MSTPKHWAPYPIIIRTLTTWKCGLPSEGRAVCRPRIAGFSIVYQNKLPRGFSRVAYWRLHFAPYLYVTTRDYRLSMYNVNQPKLCNPFAHHLLIWFSPSPKKGVEPWLRLICQNIDYVICKRLLRKRPKFWVHFGLGLSFWRDRFGSALCCCRNFYYSAAKVCFYAHRNSSTSFRTTPFQYQNLK